MKIVGNISEDHDIDIQLWSDELVPKPPEEVGNLYSHHLCVYIILCCGRRKHVPIVYELGVINKYLL